MALPSSGALAASAINVELGRSATASISLATAATGGYAAINTLSPSYPNASTPHAMSEWYSYNHTYTPPVPSFSGAANTFVCDFPACGVNLTVGASYTVLNADNVLYKLSVYDSSGSSLYIDDDGMSGNTSCWDTGENGDPLGTDRTVSVQFMLKIIRRSDSAVMDTVVSDTLNQDMSFAC